MPNELKQPCKEEWAKIPPKLCETDKVIQNDYFKLLLLKVYLQAADGVHLVFSQTASAFNLFLLHK